MKGMRLARAVLTLVWALPALAQQSASYTLEEHVLNAGGRPLQGAILTSPHFKVTLDSIGEGVGGTDLGSSLFHMDGGFVPPYLPPGEVVGLLFSDEQTLHWDAEKSVGDYNLYRDLVSNLNGLGFGSCQQQDLASETATDPGVPAAGQGFFYLATAENRLDEEGTKGFRSNGSERQGTTCP
jgi:hypothetical protein